MMEALRSAAQSGVQSGTLHYRQLLAQAPSVDRFHEVQKGFMPGRADVEGMRSYLLLLASILAAVLLVIYLARHRQRVEKKKTMAHPRRLFGAALESLGVGTLDRVLLRWLTRRPRLAEPTVILLSPELFEKYACKRAERIGVSTLRQFALGRLRGVMERAFGAEGAPAAADSQK